MIMGHKTVDNTVPSLIFKLFNPLYDVSKKIQNVKSINSFPFVVRCYMIKGKDYWNLQIVLGRGEGFDFGKTIKIAKTNEEILFVVR